VHRFAACQQDEALIDGGRSDGKKKQKAANVEADFPRGKPAPSLEMKPQLTKVS